MKKLKLGIFLLFVLLSATSYARVVGIVLDDKGYPLVGANVYWAGTTVGVATDLDRCGKKTRICQVYPACVH